MKTNTTQQEILLLTGSTFSQRQLCEKNTPDTNKHFSKKEELEDACWNGFLKELLPEIVLKPANGNSLFLWQIRKVESFLELELCDTPAQMDNHLSIDPYNFLQYKYLS